MPSPSTPFRDMTPADCAAALLRLYGTEGALDYCRAMRPRLPRMAAHWRTVKSLILDSPLAPAQTTAPPED